MVVLDHIAIVVDDLGKAIETFSRAFGLKLSEHSAYPELGIEVAMMAAKNIKLELIQPTAPGPYWNPQKITPHFNHIAFDIDTIRSYKRRMAQGGVALLPNRRKIGKGGYLIEVDKKSTFGLSIQLIKHKK